MGQSNTKIKRLIYGKDMYSLIHPAFALYYTTLFYKSPQHKWAYNSTNVIRF